MNERYFISSKKGKIKCISIYKYNFTTDLDKQNDQKAKFCKWLKMNPEILLYEIRENCFITFLPMTESKTWQYEFFKMESIMPPFENITLISNYLGHLIRNVYNQHFEQYLNHNTYVIENVNLHPFHLLKCFDFNLEVFNDGEFFIHFLPVSKIVSSKDLTIEFLNNLKVKNENNSKTDCMLFNLIDCKYFKKAKFDLLDKDCCEKITEFIKDKEKVIATFDYHFIANYSPAIFGEITENTVKELSTSIDYLIPISQLIAMPDFIELSEKPFSKIQITHLTKRTNLLIGNGKKVNEQKAAFYNGIYQPVNDKIIQPLIIDGLKIDMFIDLISKFNVGGSVEVLNPIICSSNEDIDIAIFKQLKKEHGQKLLCTIFTKYVQPREYFQSLYDLGIKLQMYQGQINQFQLSNFTVKCLEKLGGVLNIIDNTFEPETTYFLGIDLGHTTHNEEKYSNLCVVLFDNKGIFLSYRVIDKIPRNEAISSEVIWPGFLELRKYIQKNKLPQPQKLIIHRDGKLHNGEIEDLVKQAKKHLWTDNVEIVEIIKSGYPIIAAHDENGYKNLASGDSWILENQKYGILVTNIQADDKGAILSPIIIKHRHGNSKFSELVEQVFWFTKVYTNNLYNSTRLPATTEKANNLVGTSDKRHISTYLA